MKITNEDNMELMARYSDNYFDLAIVDPPYGINIAKWDNDTPKPKYFKELFRVSQNQIIWGGNYMAHHIPITGAWLYWDKMQDGFGKTFSTGELAWTSFGSTMKQVRYKWQGNYCGFEGGITTKSSQGIQNIHPTQKPVKLYEWLLANYAKKGDRILDTHLGSGSSAIACHNLGFDLTACELDTEYFEAAMKRINQHKAQIRMF